MRNDLRPLCPAHNSQMVSAHFWLQMDSDTYPKFCYACEQPGCFYCYDIVQGYFTIRQGEHIQRDERFREKCPKEGLPMFVETFDPQGSKRTWRCGLMGCIGSRATNEPLKASAS
jgi:hypothetical protein